MQIMRYCARREYECNALIAVYKEYNCTRSSVLGYLDPVYVHLGPRTMQYGRSSTGVLLPV